MQGRKQNSESGVSCDSQAGNVQGGELVWKWMWSNVMLYMNWKRHVTCHIEDRYRHCDIFITPAIECCCHKHFPMVLFCSLCFVLSSISSRSPSCSRVRFVGHKQWGDHVVAKLPNELREQPWVHLQHPGAGWEGNQHLCQDLPSGTGGHSQGTGWSLSLCLCLCLCVYSTPVMVNDT